MPFETILLNSSITIAYGLILLIGMLVIYNLTRRKEEDYRWNYILLGVALIGVATGMRILELALNQELFTLIKLLSLSFSAIIFLRLFRKPLIKNKIFDG